MLVALGLYSTHLRLLRLLVYVLAHSSILITELRLILSDEAARTSVGREQTIWISSAVRPGTATTSCQYLMSPVDAWAVAVCTALHGEQRRHRRVKRSRDARLLPRPCVQLPISYHFFSQRKWIIYSHFSLSESWQRSSTPVSSERISESASDRPQTQPNEHYTRLSPVWFVPSVRWPQTFASIIVGFPRLFQLWARTRQIDRSFLFCRHCVSLCRGHVFFVHRTHYWPGGIVGKQFGWGSKCTQTVVIWHWILILSPRENWRGAIRTHTKSPIYRWTSGQLLWNASVALLLNQTQRI